MGTFELYGKILPLSRIKKPDSETSYNGNILPELVIYKNNNNQTSANESISSVVIEPIIVYLIAVRKGLGLTLPDVARAIGVNERTFRTWESGRKSEGPLFLRWIWELDVPEDHLRELNQPSATIDDAERLAHVFLQKDRIRLLPAQPSYADDIQTLARVLSQDPIAMGRWLGYGESLAEYLAPREMLESALTVDYYNQRVKEYEDARKKKTDPDPDQG